MPRIRAETIPEHRAQSRAALLDAAERLFYTEDYAGASLADIADEANIARTTLYEYFPSKDELLLGLIADRVAPVLEKIVSDLDTEGTALQRLECLIEQSLFYASTHIHLVLIVVRAGRKLRKDLQDRMWANLDPVLYEIGRLCAEGISSASSPRPTSP